jgi:uncharacterized damage-inducible protein DinB
MTILDRLLGHDAWTTRQLLLRCRELTDEQMDRPFAIGDRSLRQTFEHLIACMESHTDLLLERRTPEHAFSVRALRDDESLDGMLKRLATIAQEFGAFAVAVDHDGRADDLCTDEERDKQWPLGSLIAHVLTHSMHHRAQILFILEELGVTDVIEGDALGWEGQARGWGYDWCHSYGRVASE